MILSFTNPADRFGVHAQGIAHSRESATEQPVHPSSGRIGFFSPPRPELDCPRPNSRSRERGAPQGIVARFKTCLKGWGVIFRSFLRGVES